MSVTNPPGLSTLDVAKKVAVTAIRGASSIGKGKPPALFKHSNKQSSSSIISTTVTAVASPSSHNHHASAVASSGVVLGFVSLLADLIMIIGTAPGYIVQLRSVLQSGSATGFSWQSAFLLLCCYTIRVGYYFGEHYHIALLIQCFVMITVILSLIAAIIDAPDSATPLKKYQYSHISNVTESTQVTETDFSASQNNSTYVHDASEEAHFATLHPILASILRRVDMMFRRRWAGGSYYFGFITWGGPNTKFVYATYLIILAVVCFFCNQRLPPSPFMTNVFGFLALGIEACVPLPQVIHNESRHSVEGLSKFLIGTWFFGDLLKVLYFIAKSQPLPFILSGLFQFGTDLFIIGQFARFRGNSGTSRSVTSK